MHLSILFLRNPFCIYFLLVFLNLVLWNSSVLAESKIVSVSATYATPPPKTKIDSMDDPVICVHPTDSTKSLIIGTNKSDEEGGLYIYNIKGQLIGVMLDGALNNVDVRYGFPFIDEKIDIVVASRKKDHSLAIYKIDFANQTLEDIADPNINLAINSYGLGLYKNHKNNKFYALITTKQGYFHQYELKPTLHKTVTVDLVRSVSVGSQCEGIVADDINQRLFVSEEDVGLWVYEAEPDAGNARQAVARIGDDLAADVEGVTLMETGEKTGYIVVSSQGNSSYFVYDRLPPYAPQGGFQIVPSDAMEGTEETDGLDACNLSFGDAFPKGLLVVHDNRSSKGGGSNFKLISWEAIAQKLNLQTNAEYNPYRR